MLRSILISAVYHKTTRVDLSAADESTALTLINSDVERIKAGFLQIHEYWANSIEAALACWLLQRKIGAAFAAPVGVVLLCAIASSVTAKVSGRRQTLWMTAIQQRVGVTAKVVSSMKALKISALSIPMEKVLHNLRLEDLNVGGKWRWTLLAAGLIALTPSQLGPVMAFAATSRALDVSRIFTSMAYLILLAGPLGSLYQNVPQLFSALACLKRTQAYLAEANRIDLRKPPRPRVPDEKDDSPETTTSDFNVYSLRQASFGWKEGEYVLRNIDVVFPAQTVSIILGPVASGKSTLLKALLGELPYQTGEVSVETNRYRKIGHCAQSPFLYNDTIKANIIGPDLNLDPKRYQEVIEATMLAADFSALPMGDNTRIGSAGTALSGGQRQRVALARALYLESDVLLLDDTLSSVDTITEGHIIQRVFGKNGLVRQRGLTAIMTTHAAHHLSIADHMMILSGDGHIERQGPVDRSRYPELRDSPIAATPSIPNNTIDLQKEPQQSAFIQGTTAKPRLSDASIYTHYFGTIKAWVIAMFFFWCCVYGFTLNFPVIWLKYWSDDVVSLEPLHPRAFYLGIYSLLQISCLFALMVVVVIGTQTIIFQSGSSLHAQALQTLFSAPLSFYTTVDVGTVTTLFAQDLSLIDSELPLSLINFSVQAFAAMGMATVIAVSSPWSALSYPLLLAVLCLLQLFYLKTSKQLRILELEAKGPLT
ncbi:ABC transporter FUM19 [Colletotrichum orbiculare MAFF 240422]|uniref:ABC transporter FUM19 n=1 Tax=Colletotrichum orbiculare (strain 104-T / ATCC 96160 / CBS 514.97 / LARS 414 / MAFF 240422) TaxID=1213857 RepID=A0A484F8J2_COLOR|nr:ABC transporter FUM19 [Colletotrichum orbiculare MAFF 240422]